MSPQETTIDIPGHRLAAKVWGPAEGVRVLALHGWLDNAATYDGLAPLLPGLRIVALDHPGHGLSTHAAAGGLYPFVDFVAATHAVLDALSWETCVLMGHSLGASVCAMLAGTIPDRVQRLVMLEGLGPLTCKDEDAPERLAKALSEEARKRDKERPPSVYESVEAVSKILALAPPKLQPHSILTLLGRGLEPVEGGVRWRTDKRLRSTSRVRFTEAQVLAFLRRITCPSLLVRATDGLRYEGEQGGARAAAMSDLRIVEVPGCHHVHLDSPAEVAPHVAAFLSVTS